MTKDVLISISGIQGFNQDESDRVEVITSGSYYKKNNKHYLLYDEVIEDGGEIIKNVAKFNDEIFHISKSGYTNVNMSFEENKRNITNYITPYGSLLVGVDASKINIEESEERIKVDIDYSLDVNYEHLADCRLHMDITSKNNNEGFSLQ